MKRISIILVCIALVGALSFAVLSGGCTKPPTSVNNPNAVGTTFDDALDDFHGAATTPQFHAAIHKVNTSLPPDDPRLQLSTDTRDLLKDRFALDDDELKDAASLSFLPLDAHHVELCYLLRDARQFLEQRNARPLEQITRCFDWVMRQVWLQEDGQELTPPGPALRRGHGGVRERALIFLALLNQLEIDGFKIDGCIVAWGADPGDHPGADPTPLLVGAVWHDDVFLFDPWLGQPVPNPDGPGIATLAQLRARPEKFRPPGVAKDAELTVLAAPPLSALSPRMKFLEDHLHERDGVFLAQPPAELLVRLEKAARGPVRVWNRHAPPGMRVLTPVRALRAFLPPDEGGVDKTGRWQRAHTLASSPFLFIIENLKNARGLAILNDKLARPAAEALVKDVETLFDKYVQEPRLFLLRGQLDQVEQRLKIILRLDDLDVEGDLPARIAQWRERANQAYLNPSGPNGEDRLKALWDEDKLFAALLQGRADVNLGEARDLSVIVWSAMRGPASASIQFIQALAEQERAQKVLAASRNPAPLRWLAVDRAWGGYLSRHGISSEKLDSRFDLLRRIAKTRDVNNLFFQTHLLLVDLHKTGVARFQQAKAKARAGQRAAAVKETEALVAYLAMLEAETPAKKDQKEDQAEAGQHPLAEALADSAPLWRGTAWARPFEGFHRDLGPRGGFAALRQAAQRQLQEWAKH